MNIEALNQGYALMKEQLNDLQGDLNYKRLKRIHIYI